MTKLRKIALVAALVCAAFCSFVTGVSAETTLCVCKAHEGVRCVRGVSLKAASSRGACGRGYTALTVLTRSDAAALAQDAAAVGRTSRTQESSESQSRSRILPPVALNPRSCFFASASTAWSSTDGTPIESAARQSVAVSCAEQAAGPAVYMMVDSSFVMTSGPRVPATPIVSDGVVQVFSFSLFDPGALQTLVEKRFLRRAVRDLGESAFELLDGVRVASEVNTTYLQQMSLIIGAPAEAHLMVEAYCCPVTGGVHY